MKTSYLAVAVAVLALVASANAGSLPFTSCGTSSDPVSISAVSVNGTVAAGSTVALTATGTTSVRWRCAFSTRGLYRRWRLEAVWSRW